MFIYPATKFVSNGLYTQLRHVGSEADEAMAAFYTPYINDLAAELCDVIHSAETALRILQANYGVDVEVVQAGVVRKNQERGYYP